MARPNVPIVLLSVILSASVWFIRFGQDFISNGTRTVALDKHNAAELPPGMFIDEISRVTLQLAGPTSQVEYVKREPDIKSFITINLSDARPDNSTYTLVYDPKISNVVQGPPTVRVKIEMITTRTVPVKVNLRGKLKDPSSALENYPVSDTTAKVTGPKSIVDRVSEANALLHVDQINPDSPGTQDAALVAYAADGSTVLGVELQPSRVTISPTVTAADTDKKVVISPVIVGNPAPGFIPNGTRITPPEISLEGPTTTLINLAGISTEKIDVTGLTSSKDFKVRLMIPRGTRTKKTVVTVHYGVSKDPSFKRPVPLTKIPPVSQLPVTGGGGP